MKLEQKIKQEFPIINNIFFEKEVGAMFLRVEVNLKDLEEITKVSKEISEFIDKEDKTDDQYFLDVYSSGTDQEFSIEEADMHIGKNIKATLKDKDFIGKLLSVDEDKIIVEWNNKGQFKKEKILTGDIQMLNLFASVK